MSRVGIVCDSTSDLEPSWHAAHDVRMVPLHVLFGEAPEDQYLDWVTIEPYAYYERLKGVQKLPTTSQPSPADFLAVYESLAAEGCTAIVSVHLTSALSGTFESATLASTKSPIPIHVIDTKVVCQATGLVVKAAVAARDAGLNAEDVARAAQKAADRMRLFFILDTLDYLVKGGRAGKAQGLAASLLSIKPVLTFNSDGIIEPFKKVKGTRKAIAELAEHVAAESKSAGRLRVAILHAIAPELADEVKKALDASGADYELDSIGLVGSVIGNYAGPSAVGVAYYPID